MDIKELRSAKGKLEHELATAIHELTDKFRKETGVSVTNVSPSFAIHRTVDSSNTLTMLENVRVSLDLE